MSKAPEQTIIDTSVDPSLGYLQQGQVNQIVSSENGIITTRTNKGVVYNTLENVTRVISKVVETNVNADWEATEGGKFIENKPDLSVYATSANVDTAISTAIGQLINGAPTALNTLNELATSLGNNASFASTITNNLANKADTSYVDDLFGQIETVSTGNVKFSDSTLYVANPEKDIVIHAGQSDYVFGADGNLTIDGMFQTSGTGTPKFTSATDLIIQAENRVKIENASFKLAPKTNGERALLLGQTGDMIFNTTTNEIQYYSNGSWRAVGSGGAGGSFDQDLNTTDSVTFSSVQVTNLVQLPDLLTAAAGTTLTTGQGVTDGIDIYTDWGSGAVEVWLQHDDKVSITTRDGMHEWSFDNQGVFSMTDGTTIKGKGNVVIAGNDVPVDGSGPTGSVYIRGGIDHTNNPLVQDRVYINNTYIQGSTLGTDNDTANLQLYSVTGMEMITAGGGIRVEVGSSMYGYGEDMVLLAGSGGEPGERSSDGGEMIISGGHAGFNDGSSAKGGNVYVSGGNSADGQAGNVHIRGGAGDGSITGTVKLQSGLNTWGFDNNGIMSLPVNGGGVAGTIKPSSPSGYSLGSDTNEFDTVNVGSLSSKSDVWINAGAEYTYWYSIFGDDKYSVNANVAGTSVTTDINNNVYVLGNYQKADKNQLIAVKYSPSGEVQWSRAWELNGTEKTNVLSVSANNSNDKWLVWTAFTAIVDNPAIIGHTLLGRFEYDSGDQPNYPFILENIKCNDLTNTYNFNSSPQRGIVVVGETKHNSETVPIIAVIDSITGETIWSTKLTDKPNASFSRVTQSTQDSNDFYVVGTDSNGANKKAFLYRISTVDGSVVTTKEISISGVDVEGAVVEYNKVTHKLEVAFNTSNDTSIIGSFDTTQLDNEWNLELGADVIPIKVVSLVSEASTYDPDTQGGNVYVLGSLYSGEFAPNDKDFYVAKYDPRTVATSGLVWETTLGSNSSYGTSEGPAAKSTNVRACKVHNSNRCLVLTGETFVNPNTNGVEDVSRAFTWQLPTDGSVELGLYGNFLYGPIGASWSPATFVLASGTTPTTEAVTSLLNTDLNIVSVPDTVINSYSAYKRQVAVTPSNTFRFTSYGDLVFPDGTTQTTAFTGAAGSTGDLIINGTTITSETGDIVIGASQSASPSVGMYTFASDGSFVFPNYIKQVSTQGAMCNPGVDTVIYTGTDQFQHTFKLLLKVEGAETNGQAWDTQSCEMMVAKSFLNDKVAGSVYGLVYTSNSPLATFSTRWNSSTSRVEVLCRPNSASDSVWVRVFATEITSSD